MKDTATAMNTYDAPLAITNRRRRRTVAELPLLVSSPAVRPSLTLVFTPSCTR